MKGYINVEHFTPEERSQLPEALLYRIYDPVNDASYIVLKTDLYIAGRYPDWVYINRLARMGNLAQKVIRKLMKENIYKESNIISAQIKNPFKDAEESVKFSTVIIDRVKKVFPNKRVNVIHEGDHIVVKVHNVALTE